MRVDENKKYESRNCKSNRTDTVEGKGTKESPVCSVRRYWTLEGELISEQILTGEIAEKKMLRSN